MNKILLRLISVDTLIEFVVAHLAATVKNPSSPNALRLRSVVDKLHNATGQFLEQTGGHIGDL